MSNGYFWKDGKVVEYSGDMFTRQLREGRPDLEDCLCVDTSRKDEISRYGQFIKNDGWHHEPFREFPPEFRMHLLLLGVS